MIPVSVCQMTCTDRCELKSLLRETGTCVSQQNEEKNLREEESITKNHHIRIVKNMGDTGSLKTTPDTVLMCLARFTMEVKWKKVIPLKVILHMWTVKYIQEMEWGSRDVAQFVECWCSLHEALGSIQDKSYCYTLRPPSPSPLVSFQMVWVNEDTTLRFYTVLVMFLLGRPCLRACGSWLLWHLFLTDHS